MDNERILCVQRNDFMSHPLKWEFPGGKIETGEDPVTSLKREIREELEIDIEVISEIPQKHHYYEESKKTINLIPFLCRQSGGALFLHEHKNFKWLRREELSELDWAEADLFIVDFLQNNYDKLK